VKRITLAGLATLASSAAVLGAVAAGPASAGTHPVTPKNSTAGCQVTSIDCNEPVVAVSQTSGTDFVQADDAALTAMAGNVLGTRQNNGVDNGTQDFSLVEVETVPSSGHGSYGFTNFDRTHWAGQPVDQEEWTPNGTDSGMCADITRTTHVAVLQPCGTGAGQAFIVTRNVPGINSPANLAYSFLVNARQVNNLQRHLLATASDTGFGQVTGQRAINHSPGAATAQMWSALP
jgi:hypothetical protein